MALGISDITALLDRWDEWKRIRDAATKVPELEARIVALEGMLGGKRPGDVCPKCGEKTLRLTESSVRGSGRDAYTRKRYRCESEGCGYHGDEKAN